MLIQRLNAGVLTQFILCQTDSCAVNLKKIQDLRECAKTNRLSDCDGRGRHALSIGQPFGTLAATAALPTPPPPLRPAPTTTTTTTTTRSQGDVTAAWICCQPARHVTGGRQSDCVTISMLAPGCENHNIIHSSLSLCNAPPPPHPPPNILHRNADVSDLWQCFINRQQKLAEGHNPLLLDMHPSLNQDGWMDVISYTVKTWFKKKKHCLSRKPWQSHGIYSVFSFMLPSIAAFWPGPWKIQYVATRC